MGNLTEKLQYCTSSVDDIKSAMIEKGLEVPDTIPLGEYGELIRALGNFDAFGDVTEMSAPNEFIGSTSIKYYIHSNGDVLLATTNNALYVFRKKDKVFRLLMAPASTSFQAFISGGFAEDVTENNVIEKYVILTFAVNGTAVYIYDAEQGTVYSAGKTTMQPMPTKRITKDIVVGGVNVTATLGIDFGNASQLCLFNNKAGRFASGISVSKPVGFKLFGESNIMFEQSGAVYDYSFIINNILPIGWPTTVYHIIKKSNFLKDDKFQYIYTFGEIVSGNIAVEVLRWEEGVGVENIGYGDISAEGHLAVLNEFSDQAMATKTQAGDLVIMIPFLLSGTNGVISRILIVRNQKFLVTTQGSSHISYYRNCLFSFAQCQKDKNFVIVGTSILDSNNTSALCVAYYDLTSGNNYMVNLYFSMSGGKIFFQVCSVEGYELRNIFSVEGGNGSLDGLYEFAIENLEILYIDGKIFANRFLKLNDNFILFYHNDITIYGKNVFPGTYDVRSGVITSYNDSVLFPYNGYNSFYYTNNGVIAYNNNGSRIVFHKYDGIAMSVDSSVYIVNDIYKKTETTFIILTDSLIIKLDTMANTWGMAFSGPNYHSIYKDCFISATGSVKTADFTAGPYIGIPILKFGDKKADNGQKFCIRDEVSQSRQFPNKTRIMKAPATRHKGYSLVPTITGIKNGKMSFSFSGFAQAVVNTVPPFVLSIK